MSKKARIDTCHDCPYYDNEYYTYECECLILNVKTDPDSIPDNCPLKDWTEEDGGNYDAKRIK